MIDNKEPEKTFHIAIGIPSLGTWDADFAMSVIGICTNLKSIPLEGYDGVKVTVINFRSSAIAKLRQDIVEEAQRLKADWLLFVDSDQSFPPDMARKLIATGKEVIGCNIAVKRLPSLPTARRYEPKWPLVGDIVYTKPDSTGLEKIWKLGFGVMLIKMSIFDKLKKPYFNFSWNDVSGFVGEDWYFCQLLTEAGIDLWIDHDVSKTVGHAGTYIFTHEDVDYKEEKLQIVRPGEEIPE